MRLKFNSTKTAVKFEIVNGTPHFIDTEGRHWAVSQFSDDPKSLGSARRYKQQLSPVGHDGGYHPVFEGKTNVLSGYDIDPEKNKLKINSVIPTTDVPAQVKLTQRPEASTTPMINVLSYTRDGIEKIKDEESKVNALLDAYKTIVPFDNNPFLLRDTSSYKSKKKRIPDPKNKGELIDGPTQWYNIYGELLDGQLPPNFIDKTSSFRPVHIVTAHLPGTDGPKRYYLHDFNIPEIEDSLPGIQRVASPETLQQYSGMLQKIIRTPALEDSSISSFFDTSTIKPGHVITVKHNYPGSSFHHPVINVLKQYYLLDHDHTGIERAYPGITRLGRPEIIGLKQYMQSNSGMDITFDNNELNNRNELLVPAQILGQGVGSSFKMQAEGSPELLKGGTNGEPAHIDCKIINNEAPDQSLFDF